MNVLTSVNLDLTAPQLTTIYAMQGDVLSRKVEAALYNGTAVWTPPAGATCVIRFVKPDGTIGYYDTDENDNAAYTISGNKITFVLAGQALAVPGAVHLQLDFYAANDEHLSSFPMLLDVRPAAISDDVIESGDYVSALTRVASQLARDMAIYYGAPRTASTAAGMTDHSLVYVFTGTTTATLTNGHWYYWNGSVWTDGGVYNSTALTTDTTLTVAGAAADAKAVGDRAVLTGGVYTTAAAFNEDFNGDYDNLTPNRLVCIGASAVGGSHAPWDNFIGIVWTVCFSNVLSPGDFQLAMKSDGRMSIRYYHYGSSANYWTAWSPLARENYAWLYQKELTASDDMDVLTAPGIYYKNSSITVTHGVPSGGSDRARIMVFADNLHTAAIAQMWVNVTTGGVWTRTKSATNGTFTEWKSVLYAPYAVTGYATMITTADALSAATGTTKSMNDLPANSIVTFGASVSSMGGTEYAEVGGSTLGTYLTMAYSSAANANGVTQIFVGHYGMATRWKSGGTWRPWNTYPYDDDVYYVGPTRDYTSLTTLLQSLSGNTRRKTIYIDPGTYDVFKEYRAANVPTPPDDVSSSDYFDYVVFLPRNTRLIGVGNVTLRWDPDATVAEDPTVSPITYGEARTWSPLNIRYACEVENIEITCHKGRYCIHDDSHNDSADQNVRHTFRNVRCYYTEAQDGYGFNNVIGFGFSQQNKYLFENCVFKMLGGNHDAFYGHGASGSSLAAKDSPVITVNNCVMICGDTENGRAIKLQNLGASQLDIKTMFSGCYLYGRVWLQNYSDSSRQGFDVTLLKSGNPDLFVPDTNPYPVKVYQ